MSNLGDYRYEHQPYPTDIDTRTELKADSPMKVRDQRNDMEWTVCGECSCDGKDFYIIKAGLKREHTLLEKRYCVPVYEAPTKPCWQDVTGECEFRICKDGTALSHHWEEARPEIGCNVMVNQTKGYRLRKVPVIFVNEEKHEGDAFDMTVRAAFIVERKVSE